MASAQTLVIIHGGGEMGSAVGHALHREGYRLLVLDRPLPGALRLGVAFCAAAVAPGGVLEVQGVEVVHAADPDAIEAAWAAGRVALFTGDPAALSYRPAVLIDARMRQLTEPLQHLAPGGPHVLGIGPGFTVGEDCHQILESNRGPALGRVIQEGSAEAHTGVPGEVQGLRQERILRSPVAGVLERRVELGAFVEAGEVVARVGGQDVTSGVAGMVRGLKLDGVRVGAGHKIGDVDPRRDRSLLQTLTDKAEALGRAACTALELAGISPQNQPTASE
ncbi:MAG: molybdenum hydroxylase [Deltaproteobacteria bacterium]|nr:molybdenum hydroxylase [Deltaproteobacteria bacterium]